MKEKLLSITALGIAYAREVKSEKPQGVRMCHDPYTAKLIDLLFHPFMRIYINTGYFAHIQPGGWI